MDDLEDGRGVAQQPVRARGVAGGEHEPVAAAGQRVEQVAQHVPQAGKALEGAELEELVEQERGRRAAGRAGRVEERERLHRRPRGRPSRPPRPARATAGTATTRDSDWRKRSGVVAHALDVDVLRLGRVRAIAQAEQQRRTAAAAPAEHDRDARAGAGRAVERGEDAALQRGALGDHHDGPVRPRPSSGSIGMSIPRSCAVAIASG